MKNNKIQLSFLVFIAFAFSSCCHGYHVALHNYSDTAKSVKVTDFQGYEKAVVVVNNADVSNHARYSLKELPVIVDSIEYTYTFTLEKGKNAMIERGLGWPSFERQIIIDGRDTIFMKGEDIRTIVKYKRWRNYTSFTTIIR